MKLILFALLFPCICNAQRDRSIYLDTTKYKGITLLTKPPVSLTVTVFNENQKILAEVDTSHHLKIYGDTLSVLKAIFKSYNVEIKP